METVQIIRERKWYPQADTGWAKVLGIVMDKVIYGLGATEHIWAGRSWSGLGQPINQVDKNIILVPWYNQLNKPCQETGVDIVFNTPNNIFRWFWGKRGEEDQIVIFCVNYYIFNYWGKVWYILGSIIKVCNCIVF